MSPTPETDSSEPMEVDNKTEKDKEQKAKLKEEKPSSPKSTTSDSLQPSHSSSHSASSSPSDLKQEKDLKKTDVKEEKGQKEDARKGSIGEKKMDVDQIKLKTKTEKTETCQAGKSSRPSSTPPSDTGMRKLIFF